MKNNVLYLVCLMAVVSAAQAGELYRWTDQSGKMHYSDTPPPASLSADVEHLNLSGEPAQNEDMPYETRQAQQNFPVTLYVGESCGVCNQARNLLNNRGIPFSEKFLRTKQDVASFKQLSGIDGVVPVLAVGNTFIKGFLETEWNSELDIAGYPKTSGYRQRIAQPAPPKSETSDTPATEKQNTPDEPAAR